MKGVGKVAAVAWREFASTALTKGFIVGALVIPAIFAVVMPVIGLLIEHAQPPAEKGKIAIVDRSGELGDLLTERLSPEGLAAARAEAPREIAEGASSAASGQDIDPDAARDSVADAAFAILGETPEFTVEVLSPDSDVESLKPRLYEEQEVDANRTLALIVVDDDAVLRHEGEKQFGSYDLFVRPKVDVRTTGTIQSTTVRAIRDVRYRIAGADVDELKALTTVARPTAKEVSETGTKETNEFVKVIMPFAMMFLLFMGVMTGGQYLLTTMVEEKSSRVVEVLLSAVSPMQLMFGKIMGQMFVGLALLAVYTGLGIVALITFQLMSEVRLLDLVYMLIFFIIAYITIAAFMAAIGAAVNELREAQSLMAPVMIVLVLAFYLSFPVSLSPNAPWAVAMSFIPPVSNFAMLTRIASTQRPDDWQIWLSILVSAGGAWVAVWAAAKVFRVGLLMFGKPPNFRTLVKWIRMA